MCSSILPISGHVVVSVCLHYPSMCVHIQTKEPTTGTWLCSSVDYSLWCRSFKQLVCVLHILISNCLSEQWTLGVQYIPQKSSRVCYRSIHLKADEKEILPLMCAFLLLAHRSIHHLVGPHLRPHHIWRSVQSRGRVKTARGRRPTFILWPPSCSVTARIQCLLHLTLTIILFSLYTLTVKIFIEFISAKIWWHSNVLLHV